MRRNLTITLDEELICHVKQYAARSGKSVSRLVEDYFALISAGSNDIEPALTQRVRSLLGALSSDTVSESDYHSHLEEQHR